MTREALQQAIDALILNNQKWKSLADSGDAGFWEAEEQQHYKQTQEAIEVLRSALAQQGEPVAELIRGEGGAFRVTPNMDALKAIYALPAGTHKLYAGAAPAAQPERKRCVKCGDALMSDFTSTCYACDHAAPAAQKVDIPARAEVEFARLTGEIQRLAVSIWSSDYRSESPHWTVLPDAFGALSQISNMVSGMERKAAPAAQPEGDSI